jgi:GT2 family glycosyltransferase
LQISIIIVNHNTPEVLRDCLESVHKFENSENLEIIIVDNASKDNSKDVITELTSKYNNTKSIFLDELKSFSFANNKGIEKSKSEYILVMNPDIIFTGPVLGALIKKIEEDNTIGAISPALLGTDGNFQRNYFQRYPTIRQFIYYHSVFAKLFNRSAKRMNKYLENQDIDISSKKIFFTEQIPCAFFLTKKSILESIGLMDENFILFFEDVDLSYRMHKNYRLAVETSLQVIHLGGASFKSEDNWQLHGRFIKSMIYFFEKHYSAARAFFLKILVRINSYIVLIIENLKKITGKSDTYRIKKHKFLLNLLSEK